MREVRGVRSSGTINGSSVSGSSSSSNVRGNLHRDGHDSSRGDGARTGAPADNGGATRAMLGEMVGSLAESLGLSPADTVVSVSATMLAKMVSPYSLTQASVQHTQRSLTARAPDAGAYAAAYRRAREKGVPALDRFLMVLARIAAEPEVMQVLCKDSMAPFPADAANSATPDAGRATSPAVEKFKRDVNARREAATASTAGVGVEREVASSRDLRVDVPVDTGSPDRRGAAPKASPGDDKGRPPAADGYDDAGGSLVGAPAVTPTEPGTSTPALPSWFGPELASVLPDDCVDEGDRASVWQAAAASSGRDGAAGGGDSEDVASQEAQLTQEMLTILLGVSADTVPADGATRNFVARQSECLDLESVDALLRDQTRRLLDVGSHIVEIASFVREQSEYAAGMTGQAMAATLRKVLSDWRMMVVQMEHHCRCQPGGLSLASVWFYVQPSATALQLLADALRSSRAAGHRGAALLDMLTDLSVSLAGDAPARDLVDSILRDASAPLVAALETWLVHGRVDDPYGEFMIHERPPGPKAVPDDEDATHVWRSRFTLRESGTPRQLGQFAEVILATGRMRNALEESSSGSGVHNGERDENPAATPVSPFPVREVLSLTADAASRHRGGHVWSGRGIFDSYEDARRSFQAYLFGESRLIAVLESVKKFLLLGQGDFLVHFMDSADSELRKPSGRVRREKLQSLVELALRTSSAASDGFHEDVACTIEKGDLHAGLARLSAIEGGGEEAGDVDGGAANAPATAGPRHGRDVDDIDNDETSDGGAGPPAHLTGYDCFALDFSVSWPVNLVLSRRALQKYQILFRHIFHCKHVEQSVAKAWQSVRRPTKSPAPCSSPEPGPARISPASISAPSASVVLRGCQLMLHFLQNLLQYMTFEVVEPNFFALRNSLAAMLSRGEHGCTAARHDHLFVEEICSRHEAFLDACMKECMLFWPLALRRLVRIKRRCLTFAQIVNERVATGGDDAVDDAGFGSEMEAHLRAFQRDASKFVATLEDSALLPEKNLVSHLLTRLNFNGFYDRAA